MAVVIAAAALVLAGGGVAVAETSHTTGGHGHRAGRGHDLHLKRVEHGQFVTKDGKTHDVAGGAVTAVSATAITVKSADGTTTSFTVSSSTEVHVKGQAKGATTTVTSLKPGQQVMVIGTGTGPFAATRVFAR